jgi:hypothetical protein
LIYIFALAGLAEAKAKMLERQELVASRSGGDVLTGWNKELLNLSIDRAETQEQQAIRAKQEALEKATRQLKITEEVLRLVVPGHTIGEAVGHPRATCLVHPERFRRHCVGQHGVAALRVHRNLNFVKQWGEDNYALVVAHTVRADKYDNVWMTTKE